MIVKYRIMSKLCFTSWLLNRGYARKGWILKWGAPFLFFHFHPIISSSYSFLSFRTSSKCLLSGDPFVQHHRSVETLAIIIRNFQFEHTLSEISTTARLLRSTRNNWKQSECKKCNDNFTSFDSFTFYYILFKLHSRVCPGERQT